MRAWSSSAARLIASLSSLWQPLKAMTADSSLPERIARSCSRALPSTSAPGSRCVRSRVYWSCRAGSWREASSRIAAAAAPCSSSGSSLPKALLNASAALSRSSNSTPFLGRNERLAEEVVVLEGIPCLDAQGRVDRLPLAGRLDLAGADQRDDQEADHVELPAVRFLGELVGQRLAGGGDPVVVLVLDPGIDLGERPRVGVEDRLALDVADQAELGENRGQTVEVLADEQSLQVLLGDPGRRLGEAVENVGKDVFEELAALSCRRRSRPRRGCGRCRGSRSCRPERLLEPTLELVLVTLEPMLFLGDERELRLGLRGAFLAGEHFLGAVDLDRLAVDGIVQGRRPEEALGLGLAAGAMLATEAWYSLPGGGELELER